MPYGTLGLLRGWYRRVPYGTLGLERVKVPTSATPNEVDCVREDW